MNIQANIVSDGKETRTITFRMSKLLLLCVCGLALLACTIRAMKGIRLLNNTPDVSIVEWIWDAG